MSPAERLLNVRGPVSGITNAGLAVPESVAQFAMLAEGLVDYVQAKTLSRKCPTTRWICAWRRSLSCCA